jgi:hypothetical protein
LPFREQCEPAKPSFANPPLSGELKLGWDDRKLYVAAAVVDATAGGGHIRIEDWVEAEHLRGKLDDASCAALLPFEGLILELAENPAKLSKVRSRPEWNRLSRLVQTNAAARAALESGAAEVLFRARRVNPEATYQSAAHVYREWPVEVQPHVGDTLQIGFDLLPGYGHHRIQVESDRLTPGMIPLPDTDYEFAAYACSDGGTEVWQSLKPGSRRSPIVPGSSLAELGQGPVPGAECVVVRENSRLVYELAIPWSSLSEWTPKEGETLGCVMMLNDEAGGWVAFGEGKHATVPNELSLYPHDRSTRSAGTRWRLGK